jgi:hypothetical protein
VRNWVTEPPPSFNRRWDIPEAGVAVREGFTVDELPVTGEFQR